MAASLLPIKDTTTGMPGWLASRAGRDIGRIYDFGRGEGMRWRGYAMDGTRFSARSQATLIQKLEIHAAAAQSAPDAQPQGSPSLTDKTKARFAAAQGVTRLKGITADFARARDLADAGDDEGARQAMAPLKDQLLAMLDVLNFANVRGLTERPSTDQAA
ncbi:hypothetical protein [Nitrospirillum amazonense]|uniref:hypothetical protein n=1 Tax=Nitrospirillum amazonense TaxID=28077 RepID=UPI00241240B7|nr:hypothetical protein [Nitrospirillum amazonense]MDG3444665.1 hypothetical protein [Nitrospirillum amazonense]